MANKVDIDRLLAMIKQGKSQKECAIELGVSEATISKHLKKARRALNRNIALFSAGTGLDTHINYLHDLAMLQKQTKDMLDMVYSLLNEEDTKNYFEARAKLQRLIGEKGSLQSLMLGLSAELRKQLQFSFDIDRITNDLEKIKKVQQVILETIQKTDLETARKIVAELVRLKIIRSSLDFDITSDAVEIKNETTSQAIDTFPG